MEVQKKRKKEQLSGSDSDASLKTQPMRTQQPHQQHNAQFSSAAAGASTSTSMATRPPPQNAHSKETLFQEKIDASSRAIKKGDYPVAIRMYTEALDINPNNHILYSNRSSAYLKVGKLDNALKDARKAKELKPKWAKAYIREAAALQQLGREAESLASLAVGLVQDGKNTQLLETLVKEAAQSQIKEKFCAIYTQLQTMHLEVSPFVVISVIGQELQSAGCYTASLTLLESALRIGTCSLKLRGSVFSALSTAHWALGNIDKAIACMQQDLAVAKSLGDQEGECRAHGNLGAAYFSKGSHKEALQHRRAQLILAMRFKDPKMAGDVLSHLGHVYMSMGDYPQALTSHQQSVKLIKQSHKDKLTEAREIGNVGAVFLAMGESSKALECHNEHLKLAKQMGNKTEEARAYSDLGSAYHYKRDFEKAVQYHNQVLNIASDVSDRTLEARAYAGLGHASRCMQNWSLAKHYHEKQLDNALQTKDKVAEGRSCSNLGIVYQQMCEYDAALKLHKQHLQIAKDLGDRASQGRAYGNIGNAYSALGQYDVAIRFHKQELAISKEVCDKNSESSTHGNLAVAYQSLKINDKASFHYEMHLKMSRELKDSQSEAKSLSNLGNYYSSLKQYSEAIPCYEQYLSVSQELQDTEGEGKACHKLGYVHYCIGNYREAIRYYEQDLALAKDLQDKSSMCRAYCNLGLAHKALGDYPQSLECQKYFLATAHMTKNHGAKFSALGHIGDVLLKLDDVEQAIQMFNQQLQIAKQCKERKLEASSFGNLGGAHRLLKLLDKSLAYHNQELTIYQELNDIKGECKAHGHLGNVHMSLGNYTNATRCYEEMLDHGRELKDSSIEALAYGNLGIAHMNLGHFDDAIGLFEQQLGMLEQFNHHQIKLDKAKAFGNLGDCYEALGDFDEAVKCYEQYLAIAQNTNSPNDQDKAYRGLGNAHKALGNLQQALVCFEKRLVVTHEMDKPEAKSSAYGELGCLHSLLGNFEQAISCLQNQLRIAREMGERLAEGEAVCGLGGVYQQMGEYERALEYHQMDLQLAKETSNVPCQCRAFGNLGLSHESLGNYEEAIHFQEQHLNIAVQMADNIAKTLAFSSLGRVHHAMGNYPEAIRYLKEGLVLAEQFNRQEDEAKIRHRLGLALWGHGDLEEAQRQLYRATDLFESIRREAQCNNDYKLSMFDLQTASYQVLQRVLVSLGRHDEALVVAERGRTRAFVDFLLERQKVDSESWYQSLDSTPVTKEQILETVAKQQAAVLYYSLAAGYLYCWLITPDQGIVKFHESSISELESGSDPEDTQSLRSFRSLNMSIGGSVLDGVIGHVRESLGVEAHISSSRPSLNRSSLVMSETESEADDIWQQHLEELGERLNAENDRTGFLRMVNRNHLWNASSYSMNSLFSTTNGSNSINGLRAGSTRSKSSISLSGISVSMSRDTLSGKAPLSALYDMLVAPMEAMLQPLDNRREIKDLVLVLQGDLYLIPFAILRNSQTAKALYERFNLIAVPSIRALNASLTLSRKNRYNPDCTSCLSVGNPKLPQTVMENWQWGPLIGAEQECRMVSEMLGSQPITGSNATKDTVLQQIDKCEVLHFATHVSWKLAALVLSSHGDFSTTSSVGGNLERMDLNDSNSEIDNLHGPSLSEFLLTAADILNHEITAKLVVLSSGHSEDRAGRINSDGVVGLTRAFLAAGAQCVLFSLWPIPDLASRSFLKAFYTSLLQGAKTSQALSEAMKAVQSSKTYSHPANWAGWVIIGSDVKLSSKVALMGHALCQLLKSPSTAREGMRVVLHLVEKSLQRIRMNQRNAMYTTVQSIQNKVGEVVGWRDLLTAVGFRFEAGNNSLPDAVFFPTADPGDRLTQCSASLQALLGLAVPTLTALSKMTEHIEIGETLTTLIRDVNHKYAQGDATIQLTVSVRLWRAPGCHEFLASLGFDLVDVGRDEVTIKAGKQANRRLLQFALQALVAIFDTQDAPRTLLLDASSSMESLVSTGSGTSTSNFSKGSSPPTSPNWKKKSFFNPAEVEKLPSAGKTHSGKSSKSGGSSRGSVKSNVALQLNHQDAIRRKYSSPSASDTDPQEDAGPTVLAVEMTDMNFDEGDNSSVCSNSGVPKYSSKTASLSGGSIRSMSSNRRISHQPSRHPYSTSASDSEDANVPENNLSKHLSQSRSSLASLSSTVTIKSTGSGGGFRRSKARSSVASTRSSASDRTITNDNDGKQEEFIWDSRENFNFDPEPEVESKLSIDISVAQESEKSKNRNNRELKKQASLETAKSMDSGIDLQSSQASQNSPPQKHSHTLEDIPAESSDLSLSLSSNTSSAVQSPQMELPPPKMVIGPPSVPQKHHLNIKPVLSTFQKPPLSTGGQKSAFTPTKPQQQPSLPPKPKPWYQDNTDNENEKNSGKSTVSVPSSQPGMDPTFVAYKVMMETAQHKAKLDAVQKWSSANLQQKRLVREMEDVRISGADSEAEGQSMVVKNDDRIPDMHEIEVSSNLSDSSVDKSNSSGAAKLKLASISLPSFSTSTESSKNSEIQPSKAIVDPPCTTKSELPITIQPQVPTKPKLVINNNSSQLPEYTQVRNKPKPILANSLKDNNSSFTIANTPNSIPSMKMPAPMPISSEVPDLQDQIIERQLNRLNEGLATIPEYGVSQFSSTDTDYEPIHNLPHGPVQPGQRTAQNKGALKSARTRTAIRQKVVKFKDEVGGNIESPSEDHPMMTPSNSNYIQVQQAMSRNLSTRYSDDEISSDSQSDLGSMQSSFLNSSLSSREGSLTAPIHIGGLVQQKVNSIMQNIRPPSPGKQLAPRIPAGTPMRGQHPIQIPAHLKPQSPTGSSSGTATPPYIPPSVGTPPYKLPTSPGSPLSSQVNFLYQGQGGQQTMVTGQRPPSPGRYPSQVGYREPPPYPGQKPNSPVTSAPMVPPRNRRGSGENSGGSMHVTNGPENVMHSSYGSNVSYQGQIQNPSLPSSPEQQFPHQQDFNSPSNLHLAAKKLYSMPPGDGQASPSTPTTMHSPGPNIPGRIPISSLVQNKSGTGSPGNRNVQQQQHSMQPNQPGLQSGYLQYTPQSRFQPMNKPVNNLHHASSVESIQSLQSFHSFPGGPPQSPPIQQGYHGNLVASSSIGSSKEWYQSDSDASVYASGEEMMQYQRNLEARAHQQQQMEHMQNQQQAANPTLSQQNVNQMRYIQQPSQGYDASHDDSWYRTTTDDEAETPPRGIKPQQQQPPQRMIASQGQQQQQMMMSSQNVFPSQTQRIVTPQAVSSQLVRMPTQTTSFASSQPRMQAPNVPQSQQPRIMSSFGVPVSQQQMTSHNAPAMQYHQSQNGPVSQQQRMASSQGQSMLNHSGGMPSSQNSQFQPNSQLAYSQQVKHTPQPFMTASSKPVAQFANSGFKINSQTSHMPQAMGQMQGQGRNVNSSQSSFSHNPNMPQNTNQIHSSAMNVNHQAGRLHSLSSLQGHTDNSQLAFQQGRPHQQQSQNVQLNEPSNLHSSQGLMTSQSMQNPPLPPKSMVRAPAPQFSVTSSNSAVAMASSNSVASSSGSAVVDDVTVVEADEKWLPPKAQQRAEHQTRMGFLFRDMNLKASQC